MGCYGALYALDVKNLHTSIIPAIRDGNTAVFNCQDKRLTGILEKPQIIKKCAGYIDSEFLNPLAKYDFGGDIRQKEERFENYYDFCMLVEIVIVTNCLVQLPELPFGKKNLDSVLSEKASDPHVPSLVCEVIDKLTGPCFWTHNSGGYYEGIRGWIDETDVAILFDDLDNLDFDSEESTVRFRNFITTVHANNWGLLNGGDLRFPSGL